MRPPNRPLVVGVATPGPDDPALAAGLRLAARRETDVHLVHVTPTHPARGAPTQAEAATLLSEAAERAMPVTSGRARVLTWVLSGDPERRLLEAAMGLDAELLVLGATRRGRIAGAVLGTTAGHVLRAARTPILVVHEPLPDRPLRVLLTTDLSRHAVHAHSRGAGLALALSPEGAEMRSLFVDAVLPSDNPWDPIRGSDDAWSELDDFLDAETPRAGSAACVRAGDPAEEIVREAQAWPADLVVLGTHGRSGVPRILLGSVAETVLRHAPCAALVIPPVRPYSMAEPPSDAGTRAAGPWAFAGPHRPVVR